MPNPTTYRKEYCEQVRSLMGEGYSIMAVAGQLGFSRQRLYDWAERHKEMAEALDVGRAARVYKLEKDLLSAESGAMVTSRIFALKNAGPDEWKDRVETVNEHTHQYMMRGPEQAPDAETWQQQNAPKSKTTSK